MNISKVASRTGLTSKTIRYYESIGLIEAARRLDNGYRDYSEQQLQELKFVQQARVLGFSLDECRELLELNRNKQRRSADVKKIAGEKLADVETKIQQLQAMKSGLCRLIESCAGDENPDCSILTALSDQ
ncbi:transcriptional regulator [Endozoicomonas montiporae]|uniref:HTH-type transcriptional regulator CueR n=2 Tax=Endozoicomonas montiporae TaxID=1027273 RepID=A0A081MYV5_9GAMM|nr:Cu(I)-responsive transcriptional regulator [Endozoicomonas montiporae]AMO54842.1 Cu(I)-responsive transcriptional regulator [Endozoicomonas montiporae CL-33]KEQ11378.1 transcriptional regulator [Endozoicomonas montiporae]